MLLNSECVSAASLLDQDNLCHPAEQVKNYPNQGTVALHSCCSLTETQEISMVTHNTPGQLGLPDVL